MTNIVDYAWLSQEDEHCGKSPLTPREALILRMRFGMALAPRRSIRDIANFFRIEREQVRNIQTKALKRLRFHASLRDTRPLIGDISVLIKVSESTEDMVARLQDELANATAAAEAAAKKCACMEKAVTAAKLYVIDGYDSARCMLEEELREL